LRKLITQQEDNIMHHRATLACAVLAPLVVACSDPAGSGGSNNQGVGPQPGRVAAYRVIPVPGFTTVGQTGLIDIHATNSGVYVGVYHDATARLAVHRLRHGTSNWQSWTPTHSVYDFTPVSRRFEQTDVFSVYWSGYTTDKQMGMHNLNTGTPSFQWRDDIWFDAVVAPGEESTMRRAWALARGSDGLTSVYREHGGTTARGWTSDRYELVGKLPRDVQGAVAGPADQRLYAGSGDRLYVVETGGVTSYPLPGAASYNVFGTMVWSDGALYIGFNDRILRYQDRQVSTVATAVGMVPLMGPTFCVRAGTAYTNSGEAIDVRLGTRRSFIGDAATIRDQAEMAKLVELQVALGGGRIACSGEATRREIYALTHEKLYEIQAH
jgi:hypothetical protein